MTSLAKRLLVIAILGTPIAAHADLRGFASPGPLASPHAAFDHLCDKCHVPFKGIPNTSCLGCHDKTAQRIATGKGTHAAYGAQKCTQCHKDHRGRDHELSPPVERKGFDHAVTGFRLEGQHDKAACAQCHVNNKWVGQAKTCVGCHADVHHKNALGDKCETCHAPTTWTAIKRTREQHRLPMTGGHEKVACAQCHTGGKHLTATSQCKDCHVDKHGGTSAPCDRCHKTSDWKTATFQHDFCTCILPAKHQTAQCLQCHPKFVFTPNTFVCAGCHLKDRKHEDLGACSKCHSAVSWKTKAFDHNKQTKFQIEGKHTEIGCENCHAKKGVFKGLPSTCEGCHTKKGPPRHGDFGACAQCHTTAGFKPSSFEHDKKTRFALVAPHASVACQTCHARFAKGSYAPGPNACALCHGDPHNGQFTAPPAGTKSGMIIPRTGDSPYGMILPQRAPFAPWAKLAPSDGAGSASPGACLDCHTTTGWKPSTVTVAAHDRYRFRLENAHATVPCARCHPGGQLAIFRGTDSACNQCHTDAHGGRFGSECASCHDTKSFKSAPGFDHGKATGFVLTAAHTKVACAGCHGEERNKLDKVARPFTCASCHTPKHGAQFGADCTSCHNETSFRDVASFDHRARTSFPLERRHAALPCAACHDQAKHGVRLVAECRSCHGDPHRGGAGSQCQDCHRPDVWLKVRFDHDRSEFPLKGRHFITACNQCHKNNTWTGVRTECVGCHIAQRRAVANHPAVGFGCGDHGCHTAFGWGILAP